jgi:hypothetical protein
MIDSTAGRKSRPRGTSCWTILTRLQDNGRVWAADLASGYIGAVTLSGPFYLFGLGLYWRGFMGTL